MRTSKFDNNSFAPYKKNPEVEVVANRAYMDYAQARMDSALDKGLWKTNPVEFQKLVDLYFQAKKIYEESVIEAEKDVDKS